MKYWYLEWYDIKAIGESVWTEREAKVMQLRYGRKMMLEEIAREFGVTRERIRQIESKALRKVDAKFAQFPTYHQLLARCRKQAVMLTKIYNDISDLDFLEELK